MQHTQRKKSSTVKQGKQMKYSPTAAIPVVLRIPGELLDTQAPTVGPSLCPFKMPKQRIDLGAKRLVSWRSTPQPVMMIHVCIYVVYILLTSR